ncbi:MAG: haloalkane dehalogenase [Pseudomonadota bacterium]
MVSWRERKRFVDVAGQRMAWVEEGAGAAVLCVHGNPTSSYLWRNVMPLLSPTCRVLAPDLIGMGDSEALRDPGPGSYRFVDHRRFLDGWIEAVLPAEPVVLVVHDWGSALGFDWARRHPERVRGIAYMEALVRPLSWADEWPEAFKPVFEALRTPEVGEEMVLENNLFVERILPASIARTLTEDELAEYRRPFAVAGESRRPTLTWPREIPFDGEPADVAAIVADYWQWLQVAAVPKLLITGDPGAILTGAPLADARRLPHQREVTVSGRHFVQEDSAEAIGLAIRDWLGAIT